MYLGHFSFFGDPDIEDAPSGFFSCVADAATADEALDKFAALIEKMKESEDMFDGVLDVFLDSCTELREVPEEGFLDFYVAVDPEPQGTIMTAVRGASPEQATAFYIGPDEESADDEGEDESTEPFISFGD
jgi:hypothetical protein